jgi:hypothetical protein
VVYLLACCFGLAVGIGALFMFDEPESDAVKRAFLRVLGVLMVLGYGWFLAAFIAKVTRGAWNTHCESRILFFGGEPRE